MVERGQSACDHFFVRHNQNLIPNIITPLTHLEGHKILVEFSVREVSNNQSKCQQFEVHMNTCSQGEKNTKHARHTHTHMYTCRRAHTHQHVRDRRKDEGLLCVCRRLASVCTFNSAFISAGPAGCRSFCTRRASVRGFASHNVSPTSIRFGTGFTLLLQVVTAVHRGAFDHVLVHRVDEAVRGCANRVLVPGAVHRFPPRICQYHLLGVKHLLPAHGDPHNPAISRKLQERGQACRVLLPMGSAHTDVPKPSDLHSFAGLEVPEQAVGHQCGGHNGGCDGVPARELP